MKLKLKKILIVGLGNMGRSHLNSFLISRKNYEIDLVDINITTIKQKYFTSIFEKKVNYYKIIPRKKNYDLAIIATNSKERFNIIKKILSYNKIKSLILEKFLFNNQNDYKLFDDLIIKKKLKYIHVNSWGNFIYKKISKDIKKDFQGEFFINKGKLASNLIHILDFYSFASIKKKFDLSSKRLKKIKSKRKGYHELNGDLNVFTNKSKLKIITSNKFRFNTITFKSKQDKHMIEINNQSKCYHYKNKKIVKKFNFILSSVYTEKLFNRFLKNKNIKIFNNYSKIKYLSLKILSFLRKSKKFKFDIT